MSTGADVLVVGVDGLDFDVVHRLKAELPTLFSIVGGSQPHASVFPPDSVPSWTTIVTGLDPSEHGQLTNVKYFLEDADESSVEADLNHLADRCFWEDAAGDDVAIINPFLAYPPWAPKGAGAMVSGPPFAEEDPVVEDPRGLLTSTPPPRMGGFTKIPTQDELSSFGQETLELGNAQWDYALEQLSSRRWDLFFVTSLVLDRVEHYAWRHFDGRADSTEGQLIPRAHRDLDRFLGAALKLQSKGQRVILLSDHGHGPRANIGVNLHEYLRRRGLYRVKGSSARKKLIEFAKTAAYTVAPRLRMEDQAIALARRLPGKRALKSGTFVGTPSETSLSVPDLAGTNPFGGISVPASSSASDVVAALNELQYRGTPVFKWILPKGEVLRDDPDDLYPTLLFEMHPRFGPTWNLYGPVFSPVITRKRQSGGHTRRAVFAQWPIPPRDAPSDSVEVNAALRRMLRARSDVRAEGS